MAQHYEINPDQRGLALRVANRALRVANGLATARPGNVFIPNKGDDGMTDGTGTWIGSGDVGNGGVAPWIGDTTPPGKPTGITCSSAWGTLYVNWDGTLEGGVPADFAYVSVLVDGAEIARMVEAGTAVREDLENGATVQVTAVAYDAARDRNGNPAPNASEAFGPVSVQISDERAEIDAEVEEIKGEMEQAAQDAADAKEEAAEAAQAAQAASEKADSFQGQINDVTVAVNGAVQDVAELSQEVSGAVSDASQALTTATQAKQTADAISDTAQRAYENADEALTQSSSAVQTANGIVETLESDYLSKDEAGGLYATRSELKRTADEISLSVEQVRDESVILDGADGPVAVIGKNAGMAPFGIDVDGLTRQNLWVNPSGSGAGVTVTPNADGSFTLSGTSTEVGASVAKSADAFTLKPSTTYTLSVSPTPPCSFAVQFNSGTITGFSVHPDSAKTTFTSPDTITSVWMLVYLSTSNTEVGQTFSGTYRVMLNEGSEAEPWCPPRLSSVSAATVATAGKNLMPTKEYKSQFWTRDLGDAIRVVNSLTGLKMVLKYEVTLLTADDPSLIPTSRTGAILRSNAGVDYTSQVSFGSGFQIGMVKTVTYYFMVDEDNRIDHFYTYGCGNSNDASDRTNGTADVRILLRPATEDDGWWKGGIVTANEPISDDEWDDAPVTFTDIPLLGNRLRSLPDGTRDTLSVDSAGNVVMEKRVGIVSGASSGWSANPNFTGAKHGYSLVVADSAVYQDATSASPMCNALSIHQVPNAEMRDGSVKHTTGRTMIARHDTCADLASWKSWLSSSVFEMLYALEEPQTIPLGYVDLPELPADGAFMWVVAEDAYGNSFTLEPGSSFQWYGENAEALGEYATKAQLKVEADAIRSEVEETYQSKDGMSDYATVSSVEQTASKIESNVAATYQTKAGMSSYATNSSVTQTANSIKQEVAAEYTTKEDAQATYATKTSLQQTEDSILSSVESEYQSKDGMSSYATKSYVDQQDNSIKSTVSSVQTTANNALSKASTVEQTAEGLEVTLTSTTTTANNALSKANSAASAASTAQSTANTLSGRASQTYSFAGSSSAAWVRLGTLKTGTSDTVEIVVFTGIGYNGLASQNSKISIVIRDGNHNGGAANRYGVTVMREGNEANEVQVRSSAYGTAEVWVHFTGAYANGSYSISKASNVTWTHSGTAQSSAPTSGTVQNQSYLTNAAAAAKTATNYLKFDSAGLCVGNHTGTLGYNTLIKSTGVDIRNGSTVLSGFGASTVELGRNSKSAVIKMAGGVAQVKASQENGRESATFGNVAGGSYAAFSEIEAFLCYGSSTLGVDEDLNRTNMCGWYYPVGSTVLTRYSIPIGDLVDSVSRSKALVPLWSGTLNLNGSVSISSLGKYRTIGIGVPLGASNSIVETYVTIHFLSGETTLMGIGGGATASDIRIAGVRLTRSGNTLKYTYGMIMSLNPSSGLNQTRNAMPIKSIVGIG